MEKIRESAVLKILCYILIPIIALSLILSIAYIGLRDQYGNSNDIEASYLDSYDFSYEYMYSLIRNVNGIRDGYTDFENNGFYNKIDENIYYNENYTEYYSYNNFITFMKFVIVKNDTNEIFTNIQSNDYLNEVTNFKNNKIYWIYENGSIDTSIENLSQDKIRYISLPYEGLDTFEGYDVYTYIDIGSMRYSNTLELTSIVLNMFNNNSSFAEALIPIDIILLSIIIVYLIWSIGHSQNKEGITLNSLDKFSYELVIILFSCIFWMCIIIAATVISYVDISTNLLIYIIGLTYLGTYVSLAVMTVTTIKRLKAREFWHSFTTYRIYKSIKDRIKKTSSKVLDKSASQKKIIILYIAFIFVSCILGVTFFTGISFIVLIVLWIWTLYKILEYNKRLNEIKNALHEIYMGNPNIDLDTEELTGTLKELATYVNDVSNGFNNAIQEKLKSERLKTELITNVSHDIKTPLTSIINYVDLLKQENIQDEKVQEYIKVLDSKSQRLKKLIEDLVEASKASSGNVKLNIEEINLSELLKQVTGEFKDKFDERNLIIDLDLPSNNVNIQADNRYMYRIIENLYSNVSKYAMENTRVYITLLKTNDEIRLEIKNVSKDKLNITADELMQRFVRGDKSRYTEGSGLGLSIAKSLCELQDCKFDIEIDGDLFKAVLIWNIK